MKLTKLMLSACVAALALVSCNKEEHTPVVDGVKTVEMSIANLIMTKGDAGTKISDGAAVVVNDFQVFLTDDTHTHVYTEGVKGDNNAEPKFYWTKTDLGTGFTSIAQNYHYVSHHCTKIVAVANAGKQLTLAEALELGTTIDLQQDQNNLLLFANAALTRHAEGKMHESEGKYAEVYVANPILTPTVARFEVDGFVMNFNGEKYTKATVLDIAFQDYYPSMKNAVPTGTRVIPIANLDADADVYSWFNSTAAANFGWFRDSFTTAVLEKPATPDAANRYIAKADIAPKAYHFFAPAEVPDMMINLVLDGTAGTNIPGYLWTNVFKYVDNATNETKTLEQIEPGKIYRMSAAGEALGDGSIPFDEEDLNAVERCLEVTVDVANWEVILVTPEF